MGAGREYRAHIRDMRTRRTKAIEAYEGKRDLLKTYDQLGIWNDTVRKLAEDVRQHRKHLKDQGILDDVPCGANGQETCGQGHA